MLCVAAVVVKRACMNPIELCGLLRGFIIDVAGNFQVGHTPPAAIRQVPHRDRSFCRHASDVAPVCTARDRHALSCASVKHWVVMYGNHCDARRHQITKDAIVGKFPRRVVVRQEECDAVFCVCNIMVGGGNRCSKRSSDGGGGGGGGGNVGVRIMFARNAVSCWCCGSSVSDGTGSGGSTDGGSSRSASTDGGNSSDSRSGGSTSAGKGSTVDGCTLLSCAAQLLFGRASRFAISFAIHFAQDSSHMHVQVSDGRRLLA